MTLFGEPGLRPGRAPRDRTRCEHLHAGRGRYLCQMVIAHNSAPVNAASSGPTLSSRCSDLRCSGLAAAVRVQSSACRDLAGADDGLSPYAATFKSPVQGRSVQHRIEKQSGRPPLGKALPPQTTKRAQSYLILRGTQTCFCLVGRMAHPKRFELLTPRFVVWCSIQLSYGCALKPWACCPAASDLLLGPPCDCKRLFSKK